jgi:hypothetical protein
MRKKYQDKATAAFRVAVVVISLLALGVSGASSAVRAFYGPIVGQKQVAEPVDLMQLVPGNPSPEDARDEMAPGEYPNTDQAALLTAPVLASMAKNESQLGRRPVAFVRTATFEQSPVSTLVPIATTSAVSSSLGRQFTLVGSKPSGTG